MNEKAAQSKPIYAVDCGRHQRESREDGEQTENEGNVAGEGPVGLIGLALLAYGVTALIFGGHSFTQHAPTGAVDGKSWLGLEVNGWTGLLFVAAGLLLLLAAPLHWGAKGMSLIVGLALGAAALIAFAKGHGTLGIFAANHLTELVWGAAAVLLIVLSQLPRVGANTSTRNGDVGGRAPHARSSPSRVPPNGKRRADGPILAAASGARSAVPVEREPVAANGARTEAASLRPGRQAAKTAAAAPRPCKRPDARTADRWSSALPAAVNTINANPKSQEGSAWLTNTSMKAKAV